MKPKFSTCIVVLTLFAGIAIPARPAAHKDQRRPKHHHYKLIDVGTFGGPGSGIFESQHLFTRNGTLVGWADTTTADPYSPNCFNSDCLVEHGFQWRHGILRDLGAMLGVNNSQAQATNDHGLIVGNSENGLIDPYLNIPANDPVAWLDGEVFDLAAFGGYQGYAFAVNESDQVTGVATNTVPDQYSFLGGTQSRAFLWEDGTVQDLGTLGGPDAFGQFINDNGTVAGFSYTSSLPRPDGVPPYDPFLWSKKTGMRDLGNFGGTQCNPYYLNDRGELVGNMNLTGDQSADPFLWDGKKLLDLGTFGGNFGQANWVNEAGAVVGVANYPDNITYHAFFWRKGKKIKDLGTLAGDRCSWAEGMNEKGQVVGLSFARRGFCFWGAPNEEKEIKAQHAVLWEDGSIIDLNTQISPDSGLRLLIALEINDRGEIAGMGIPPGVKIKDSTFHSHAFVLIPCDENHPDIEGCDYSLVDSAADVGSGKN
jgi:probable HAF family extracellular repeat protein